MSLMFVLLKRQKTIELSVLGTRMPRQVPIPERVSIRDACFLYTTVFKSEKMIKFKMQKK